VDELERPTHYHRKRILTAFLNGTGENFPYILPRSWPRSTKYFAEGTVDGLEDIYYREGRNPHERNSTLHFDNAPVHNPRIVMWQLDQSGFKRMEHPAYSPVLASCDFFPFGHLKGQFKGRSFAEEEELLSALSEPINEIPSDMLLWVLAKWNQKVRLCLLMKGEYFE
jgi:hypothetical protein